MEQTRKKFIKNLFIGATSVPILIEACKKSDVTSSASSSSRDQTAVQEPEVVLLLIQKQMVHIHYTAAVVPPFREQILQTGKQVFLLALS